MNLRRKGARIAHVLDNVSEDGKVEGVVHIGECRDFADDDIAAAALSSERSGVRRIFDPGHTKAAPRSLDEEVAMAASELEQIASKGGTYIAANKIEVAGGSACLELAGMFGTLRLIGHNEVLSTINLGELFIGWLR